MQAGTEDLTEDIGNKEAGGDDVSPPSSIEVHTISRSHSTTPVSSTPDVAPVAAAGAAEAPPGNTEASQP